MKPISYSAVMFFIVVTLLAACSQNKFDGRYIAYKVVANDDSFGWLNDLNDTLNNALRAELEGSKLDLVIKDKYASVTLLDRHKTILLPKVKDTLGYHFEYETHTRDTKTHLVLTKNEKGEIVYIMEFKLRADIPAAYPVQLGGSPINLNDKQGRAICYLTPLK